MPESGSVDLQDLAAEAVTIGDVASAAIFVLRGEAATPELEAAAGIQGAALDGLAAAVRGPGHPVHRAFTDPGPTFDVPPVNPGGPALRSHIPIGLPGATGPAAGVLALAHQRPLDETDRGRLLGIAARVARALARRADDR